MLSTVSPFITIIMTCVEPKHTISPKSLCTEPRSEMVEQEAQGTHFTLGVHILCICAKPSYNY